MGLGLGFRGECCLPFGNGGGAPPWFETPLEGSCEVIPWGRTYLRPKKQLQSLFFR